MPIQSSGRVPGGSTGLCLGSRLLGWSWPAGGAAQQASRHLLMSSMQEACASSQTASERLRDWHSAGWQCPSSAAHAQNSSLQRQGQCGCIHPAGAFLRGASAAAPPSASAGGAAAVGWTRARMWSFSACAWLMWSFTAAAVAAASAPATGAAGRAFAYASSPACILPVCQLQLAPLLTALCSAGLDWQELQPQGADFLQQLPA